MMVLSDQSPLRQDFCRMVKKDIHISTRRPCKMLECIVIQYVIICHTARLQRYTRLTCLDIHMFSSIATRLNTVDVEGEKTMMLSNLHLRWRNYRSC